jgi:hypothetical protein
MAHQPIHPNGGIHKVDFECRCGHCRGFVAPEGFWNAWLPFHNPCGEVSPCFENKQSAAVKIRCRMQNFFPEVDCS